MKEALIKMWNDRYKDEAYSYGTQPNEYFQQQIHKLKPGKILFAAEGEGRNAVYAALQGWEVTAFDISIEGKNKAVKLAKEKKVKIDYRVGLLPELDFPDMSFDAIVLIFAHFPPPIRSAYHQLLSQKLKPGGTIILEAFGDQHLKYQAKNARVGGPGKPEALISAENVKNDFKNYKIIELTEEETHLSEGIYHNGHAWVTRFVGEKI